MASMRGDVWPELLVESEMRALVEEVKVIVGQAREVVENPTGRVSGTDTGILSLPGNHADDPPVNRQTTPMESRP